MKQKIKILLLYVVLIIPFITVSAHAIDDGYLKDLNRLYRLSRVNTNLGGVVSYDSIIRLCDSLEVVARFKSDQENVFKIQMIEVVSLCMKDDLSLAVTKSRSMYDEAMSLDYDLGIAYSTQAIGTTLFYSGQLKNALTTIDGSIDKFLTIKDSIQSVRVLSQRIQVLHYSNEMEKMLKDVNLLKLILNNYDIKPGDNTKNDFMIVAISYEVLYELSVNNTKRAGELIEFLNSCGGNAEMIDRWKQYLYIKYYDKIGQYDKAIALTDSVLVNNESKIYANELRRMLISKASLYEKAGQYEEACDTYMAVYKLSNKMEADSYSRQIETLHTSYLVDKMKVENITAQNQLLNKILICAVLVLVVAGFFLFMIFRRNRALVKSRTELAEIKNEAYNSIQSKSMFLSNMSHDLRTPLNAIVGFSDILSENDDLDEETKEMCNDHIKQNAELLTKLFSDILDISSLQENNIRFTFKQNNIVGLCENVVGTVEKVNKSMAVLRFENNVGQLEFETDTVRLKQVLINLLVNATKFTEKGSITLRLNLDKDKNQAVFMVEDTGCGIPKERQATIFERFEKLHESKQGVGLGLSICHLIVTKFGGRIWIDPDYTGGTRFIFTHPLEMQKEQ